MKRIESIDDLTPDSKNANLGTERGRGMLEQSLREFGAGRSILVDKEGVVIAGNKTLEIAEELGLPVRVVTTNGGELVVVQRRDLDLDAGDKARRLAYMDNRSSQIGLDWDAAQILADLETEMDLSGLWTDAEIAELLAGVIEEPPEDPGPQIDRAEELREKWDVERGQIWEIGKHRLMCGDSTRAEDVRRLMAGEKAAMVFTDPPYGVAYDGGTTRRDRLIGDNTTILYDTACGLSAAFSDQFATLYLWHAGTKAIAAASAIVAAGYEIRSELIWNKNQAQFGSLSAQYKQKHEPCYYCHKRGQAPRWFGPTNEVSVWDYDRFRVNEYHPTQKPAELAARAMRNSSQRGHIVADWFVGSGSTMVAAEQTGRICYGVEIEPKYVAVTLQRLADMGLQPRLVDG